ncbi:rhodanese-like domain-containing protein [Phaeocystidibacter luteus]|uniref:Rhodanese-like domain-containing protein n=1 Tax=Phaeocystidibacter luteus TaxID=911197 RepID=A0A6N6RHA1_9FLAO|nr:rhodanese-like domain-containing protein [Phaeocystidibacter luteus]KAB2813736.1 rhodanese-like domain-containing protein [Phaeocystidibacter luteus]
MGLLGKLFNRSSPDYNQWLSEGGVIVDVRTRPEYKSGHIKGSKNIPLDEISRSMHKLDKHKPVIVCCRSGMRSGQALGILRQAGFERVHNGGGWMNLQRKLG